MVPSTVTLAACLDEAGHVNRIIDNGACLVGSDQDTAAVGQDVAREVDKCGGRVVIRIGKLSCDALRHLESDQVVTVGVDGNGVAGSKSNTSQSGVNDP